MLRLGFALLVVSCVAAPIHGGQAEAAGSKKTSSKSSKSGSSKKSSSSKKTTTSKKTSSKSSKSSSSAKKSGSSAKKSSATAKKSSKGRRKAVVRRQLPPSVPIEPLQPPRARAWPADGDPELSAEKVALRKQYLAARDAFNRRDYDAARQRFLEVAEIYPAMQDYVLRDLSRSILTQSEASGLSRADAEVLLKYAQQILSTPGSAIDGWGHYLSGRALQSLGRIEEAETAYSRALATDSGPPKDALYFYLARVHEDAGRPGDAYVNYIFATQTGLGTYRDRANEGAERVGEGLDPAERGIDWVLRRDELARMLKRGADREALRLIQQARDQCAVPDVKTDLRRLEGFCYLQLARHDEATELLTRLMDEEVTGGRPRWDTIAALQKSLGKRGDRAKRMDLLSRFVASHPTEDGIEAYFVLASLLKDEGRQAEADALYQEVFNRYPGQPQAREAQWLLAWTQIRKGDHARALERLKALVEKVPAGADDESRARYWLARVLILTGEKEKGEEMFAEVVQRFPDSYYGAMADWKLHGQPQSRFAGETRDPKGYAVPGDEPAQLALNLLFPGFADHLKNVRSPVAAAHLEKAKELWLMGLTGDAQQELEAAIELKDATPQVKWMAAAMSHSMGWTLRGIKYGHVFLTSDAKPEERLPERSALAYPMPYRDAIVRHALSRGIEPTLAAALIQQESTFRADIGSPVGARGLMQIMPYTGAEIAGWLDIRNYSSKYLTQPDFNLRLGTEYMRAMLSRFNGSLVRTLASYNAGPEAVARWVRRFGELEDDYLAEEIPYKETRHYVRAVLRNYYGYLSTYGARIEVPTTAEAPRAEETTASQAEVPTDGS